MATWIEWAVIAVALLYALFLVLPYVLDTLGIYRFRNGSRGGPADLEPDGNDAHYADQYRQLRELRFEPLCIYWEQTLHAYEEERVFVLASEKCIACVHHVLDRTNVVFLTVFASGAAVRTANYSTGDNDGVDSEDLLFQHISSNVLKDVLEKHREGVVRFQAAGDCPLDCASDQDCVQVQHRYFHNPSLQAMLRGINRESLLNLLLILARIPAIVAAVCWWRGASFLWPALALIGMCLGWQLVCSFGTRCLEQEIAAEQDEQAEERIS